MTRGVLRWAISIAILLVTTSTRAERLAALAPLAARERAALDSRIARARLIDPEVFAQVDGVLAGIAELDAAKRGPIAVLAPRLAALGRPAIWALAEKLLEGGSPAGLGEPARLALAVGAIDAAGAARDAELAPLWRAILDGPEPRPEVLRSAAAALARLDDERTARELVVRARGAGAAAAAVRAAMGVCRRAAVAEELAAALAAAAGDGEARALIRSLAEVGAAWSWATPRLRARPEQGRVREVAGRALLRAFLAWSGRTRQAAGNALLVVDPPGAGGWIAAARGGADPDGRAALDDLAARLARRPMR